MRLVPGTGTSFDMLQPCLLAYHLIGHRCRCIIYPASNPCPLFMIQDASSFQSLERNIQMPFLKELSSESAGVTCNQRHSK